MFGKCIPKGPQFIIGIGMWSILSDRQVPTRLLSLNSEKIHRMYRDKFLVPQDTEKTPVPWVNVGPLQT